MTRRVKTILSAALLPIAVAAGISTIFYRPFESPTQRAYRVCAECADLEPAEVDDQIITVRSAPGTREDKLRLFRDQFDDPADAGVSPVKQFERSPSLRKVCRPPECR